MEKIRAILIDDERLSREELRRMLQDFPDVEVIAEAEQVEQAAELVKHWQPDLLFLDIQMPGYTGFDLLEMLDTVPEVIFVTAYDQYAVRAFETDALDYLVKPVRAERLSTAIDRMRKRWKEMGAGERRLFIKDGNRCHFIRLSDIWLFSSMENYARLHFGETYAHIKRSMHQLESILDPTVFFRINRSEIVNTTYIREMRQAANGRLQIRLHNDRILEISDRQTVRFKEQNRF